jgi:hypothetical protein
MASNTRTQEADPKDRHLCLTGVDSRSRADVLERRVVDSLGEDSVAELVGAGEADAGGVGAAATSDLDLEAGDVRLGLTNTRVQRKSLSSDEVVARGDVLGDSESSLSAVCVQDLSAPCGGSALVSVLGDLEERTAGSGLCVRNLGHVDHDGAVVGTANSGLGAGALVGLSVHLNGQSATSSDLANAIGLGWATATEHVCRREAVNRTVVLDGSRALGALVGGADPELLPCRVGRGRCDSGEDNESGLHCECE